MRFQFKAPLWQYDGDAAWHFVTLPRNVADEIEDRCADRSSRGFGSVKVTATIGSSRWSTSVFPSKSEESFVLPIKKQIRTGEGLTAGDLISVTIRL